MGELKQLYFNARNGNKDDASAYVEAIQTMFDSNPSDYILNLEYIIQSDIGLKTLKPFIEKYGLPIAAYESTMSALEQCVEKCESKKKDSSLYKEAIDYLKAFKEKYHSAFNMFDYYSESDMTGYIKTYYGTTNGKQNRTLAAGMLKKFGEAAMPDLIILADQTGPNASNKLESLITEDAWMADSMYCEWVEHACTGTSVHPEVSANSLSAIVEDCQNRNYGVYRESVILNKQDACYEYTDEEIDAIKSLIDFKEFVLTGMDET